MLVLFAALIGAAFGAPQLTCPLRDCADASQPSGALAVCSHYGSLSCCSARDADAFADALKTFANKFSNDACRALIEDATCGFHCSAAQQHYMKLLVASPVRAQYRVCESYCDAMYAACVDGTFDGKGAALEFTSAAALCAALPTGSAGVQVVVAPTTAAAQRGGKASCFAGRETSLRTASLLYGAGMGGGLTFANHSFTIEAFDGFGQAVRTEDASRRIVVDGPNRFAPRVAYAGDGKYSVEYAPEIGGPYEVDVVLADSVPELVPLFVSVTQASLCPLQDGRSAKPTGALAPPPVCGEFADNACCTTRAHFDTVAAAQQEFAASFDDATCRAHFDKLSCGVHCSPEQSLYFEPNSNATGRPTFSICSDFCQTWYDACKDQQLAAGSIERLFPTARQFCQANLPSPAFAVVVRDLNCYGGREPRVSCANSYVVDGDGIYNWNTGAVAADLTVDSLNSFTIQPTDIYQNKKKDVAAITWNIDFGVAGVVTQQVLNADGTTTVTWNSTTSGVLPVSITCNDGDHIEHSPIPITVRPGPFDNAILQCPMLGQTGSPVIIDVLARDRFGNRLISSPKRVLRIQIETPSRQRLTPPVTDNCDGSYAAVFDPVEEGIYVIRLLDENGRELDVCRVRVVVNVPPSPMPTPAPTFVTGGPCANTSLLYGIGLNGLPAGASAEQVLALRTFTIETRDANGAPTMTTGAQFRIDFFVNDADAGLINLRNPSNLPVPTNANNLYFKSLFPVLEVTDAAIPGQYTVTYQTRIASELVIYVVLLPEESACGGIVTGEPKIIPGSCDRQCRIGGVCTYADAAATTTQCECLRPAYLLCSSFPPEVRNRFPEIEEGLIQCCPEAPFVTGLRFADEPSTAIVVEFSTNTNRGGATGRFKCSDVLTVAGNNDAALGKDSFCIWRDAKTLVAWFGSDAGVKVGDNITLVANSIFSERLASRGAEPDQTLKLIAEPNVKPVPQLAITGHETFNPCLEYTLDAGYTSGTGGRALNFTWQLATPLAGAPAAQTALLTQIRNQLASETGRTVRLPLAVTRDPALVGKTLQFTVSAGNHFGVPAEPKIFASKIDLDQAAPAVIVVPPSVTTTRGQAVKLTAEVASLPDSCDDPLIPTNRELDFTWSRLQGPTFDLGITNLKTLYIAPGSLVVGEKYSFEVRASYKNRPELFATSHVHVDVIGSPLVASIAGGVRQFSLSSRKPLVLDGSESFDPDDSGRALTYSWDIKTAAGQPLLFDNEVSLKTAVVTVPLARLRVGVFIATLTVGVEGDASRKSVASTTITIVARGMPAVSINGPPAGFFDPARRLQLSGVIDADERDGPVEIVWETVSNPFKLSENLDKLATVPSGAGAHDNLVVKANTFAPSQRITVRLTATNNAGVGLAEYTIEADAAPNAGSCSALGYNGVALLDEFIVECQYFEDKRAQLPLSYRAFRRPVGAVDNSQDFPLTIAPVNSRELRFRMFTGVYTVVIYVSDATGTVAEYVMPQPFVVTSSTSNAGLLAQLESELLAGSGNSDADKLLNALDIIAQLIKSERRMKKRQEGGGESISKEKLDELRNLAIKSVVVDLRSERTVATIGTKLNLLVSLATSGPISQESAAMLAKFLDEQAAPSFDMLGVIDSSASNTIQVVGVAAETALSELLRSATFGRSLRTGITSLTRATLRDMIAFESARTASYVGETEGATLVSWTVQKTSPARPLASIGTAATRFKFPSSLFTPALAKRAGSAVGYEAVAVQPAIFAFADGATRVRTRYAVNGIALFDANSAPLAINAMEFAAGSASNAVQFVLDFDTSIGQLKMSELNATTAVCMAFDGAGAYSSNDCRATKFDLESVTCECARVPGDFGAGLLGRELPEGAKPLTDRAQQIRSDGIGSRFLWLILLLLLLLCAILTILGLLVLWHRSRKPGDDTDTLQPYLDKAAGMGNLALLAAGDDVSDSSELERRDYALPVGVYEIPEKTEESDLRREDFSWGLEGEPESGVASSADASEAGRAGDTYKEGRLAKMAGAAGTTATKREGLATDYDLERTADGPSAANASSATGTVAGSTVELSRPSADAQARRG